MKYQLAVAILGTLWVLMGSAVIYSGLYDIQVRGRCDELMKSGPRGYFVIGVGFLVCLLLGPALVLVETMKSTGGSNE